MNEPVATMTSTEAEALHTQLSDFRAHLESKRSQAEIDANAAQMEAVRGPMYAQRALTLHAVVKSLGERRDRVDALILVAHRLRMATTRHVPVAAVRVYYDGVARACGWQMEYGTGLDSPDHYCKAYALPGVPWCGEHVETFRHDHPDTTVPTLEQWYAVDREF